jgi:hypothetical protein
VADALKDEGRAASTETLPAQLAQRPQPPPFSVRRDDSRIRRRFGVAYFMLAVAVGAAVGFAIVLLGRSETPIRGHAGTARAVLWSAWTPQALGLQGAREIATHVGEHYRSVNGRQFLTVLAGRPLVRYLDSNEEPQTAPIDGFIIRNDIQESGAGAVGIEIGNTFVYNLCGDGGNCSLSGTPTSGRASLLRREAIELALYSFKYLRATAVVAFTPPTPTPSGRPKPALLFLRSEVAPALSRPLGATLPPQGNLTPTSLTLSEQDRLQNMTYPRTYHYDIQGPLADGGVVVTLTPPGVVIG